MSNNKQKSLFQGQQFTNRFHSLGDHFYSHQQPTPIDKPKLVHINPAAAHLLDHSVTDLNNDTFRDFACGNTVLQHSQPIAAIYAGHQFGHFVPQLGDGRALLLGEIKNSHNEHWEIQLKGAGMTPYSRQGDGRAVLRSTIREYLCSEAMHGLSIPTTRALAMVDSHEEVYREQLESGAVLVRLSPTFIRFGSFELFASRGQLEQVKQLADFVISHYYPEILAPSTDSSQSQSHTNPYALFLSKVVKKTAEMIAHWQSVGFAHGVMNTDNMSILGLTIDYGPFGFLDTYDRNFICNHSDQQGRYSFQNQPTIAYWNLARLAETLLSLMTIDEANEVLSDYEAIYMQNYMALMRQKLGFFHTDSDAARLKEQETLIFSLLSIMEKNQVDYTLFFRQLCNTENSVRDLFLDRKAFDQWQLHYEKALTKESLQRPAINEQQRKKKMKQVNPKYILRNYMAQIAIEKATEQQDYSEIDKLLTLLHAPYDEHPDMAHYAGLPPDWADRISVSCSS
ncbi:MAG: YdiU family protein [gamma proteobacterium symbiont of Bathyaustriella thionipta]|nr:YdiU family protein [gamma proteobacterium symbiont of Bathyaustriella thionipta]MCU7951677.1 YdiU family protein [gamma proteobacterium symbiont of Bathyaustriella thionipta]MCU7958274.1 YdiU family protein [gamma proteobacterium symbiont of Bathyaustriella thionipta]MCU7965807.1 YdiU family protein [gamma proteobacterium symbiont of Bathyaustriella thionipta]